MVGPTATTTTTTTEAMVPNSFLCAKLNLKFAMSFEKENVVKLARLIVFITA